VWERAVTGGSAQRWPELRVERGGGGGHGETAELAWTLVASSVCGRRTGAYPLAWPALIPMGRGGLSFFIPGSFVLGFEEFCLVGFTGAVGQDSSTT